MMWLRRIITGRRRRQAGMVVVVTVVGRKGWNGGARLRRPVAHGDAGRRERRAVSAVGRTVWPIKVGRSRRDVAGLQARLHAAGHFAGMTGWRRGRRFFAPEEIHGSSGAGSSGEVEGSNVSKRGKHSKWEDEGVRREAKSEGEVGVDRRLERRARSMSSHRADRRDDRQTIHG